MRSPFDPVTRAIKAAVASGRIADISYGNDICASFIDPRNLDASGESDDIPRLWIDYADPNDRENGPGTPRLMICAGNGDHAVYLGEFDAEAAIVALLSLPPFMGGTR